jgi:hypothetical protein
MSVFVMNRASSRGPLRVEIAGFLESKGGLASAVC